MTQQEISEAIVDLLEVRLEITRINKALGQTVFNPAATVALDATIAVLKENQDDHN